MWKRVVVDGSCLAHIYRHVYGHLFNRRGVPTGVIYGFLGMLNRINTMFSPDELLVAWDCEGPSARSIVNADYKLARRSRDMTTSEKRELKRFFDEDMPMLRSLLTKIGIPQIQYKLLEADDIIALSVSKPTDTSEWIIVSNDKDYVQWVQRDKCRLFTPTSDYLFYQEKDGSVHGGKTEFGLTLPSPQTYAVWRAIIGDKSDSIPGVPGIGVGTVYGCYRNSPPVFNLSDESMILKYLRKGDFTVPRSVKLEEAAVKKCPTRQIILDTLALMRPTPLTMNELLDRAKKISGTSSKATRAFVNADATSRTEPADYGLVPLYLQNIKKDPNHFCMYLRKMDYDLGFWQSQWFPIINSFLKLYERRAKWSQHTPWSPCVNL